MARSRRPSYPCYLAKCRWTRTPCALANQSPLFYLPASSSIHHLTNTSQLPHTTTPAEAHNSQGLQRSRPSHGYLTTTTPPLTIAPTPPPPPTNHVQHHHHPHQLPHPPRSLLAPPNLRHLPLIPLPMRLVRRLQHLRAQHAAPGPPRDSRAPEV